MSQQHIIDWSDPETPFSPGDMKSQTNSFLNCLDECFLAQCVSEPTFQKADHQSYNILDLIITNDTNKINYITHADPLGETNQGHHMLCFNYILNDPKLVNKENKAITLYKKGNYELFSKYTDGVERGVEFSNKSTNECYDIFLYHYHYATEEFIPKLFNPKNKGKKSWMTAELKNKIKYKNKMWLVNKSLNWIDEEKSREYKRLKIEVRNSIKENVKNFEQEIAGKFKSNPKLLYKYINDKRSVKTHVRVMEDEKGDMVVDNHSIANILNNYFYSVYTVDKKTQSHIGEDLTESKLITIELNIHDVESRLSKLDPNKAMGVDLAHPLVLKQCSHYQTLYI
jgi:hypothetical protein